MRIRIHMRADLRAAQAEFAHASFEFACCEIWILHWNCRQACKSLWMVTNDRGDVVVKPPRKIEAVRCFRPIAEHHRHSREHLHGNAVAVAFFDTPLWIPYVVDDLAEDAIANHHRSEEHTSELQSPMY